MKGCSFVAKNKPAQQVPGVTIFKAGNDCHQSGLGGLDFGTLSGKMDAHVLRKLKQENGRLLVRPQFRI
jgi:hypothetical protein